MIVEVQQTFRAPKEVLWDALTDPEKMKQWYFEDMPDFKPRVGFETSFTMRSESRSFSARWKVIEVVPGERITYTWSYDEYDGSGDVTFDLEEHDGSTLVTVTNTGLESFPQDIPEFTGESCENGWRYFLQGRLPEFLGEDE